MKKSELRKANTAPKKAIHEPPGSRGGVLEGGVGKALEEYSAEVVFLIFCKININ